MAGGPASSSAGRPSRRSFSSHPGDVRDWQRSLVSVGIEHGLPDETAVARIGDGRGDRVYDRNDKPAFTIFKEQRIEVPLSEMSPHLVDAPGCDWILLSGAQRLRPLPHRVSGHGEYRSGRAAQGGSTIAAAGSPVVSHPAKTMRRKIQELILASASSVRIRRTTSSALPTRCISVTAYGAEAASRGYFGKHALN